MVKWCYGKDFGESALRAASCEKTKGIGRISAAFSNLKWKPDISVGMARSSKLAFLQRGCESVERE
jgi:hypothetical protein